MILNVPLQPEKIPDKLVTSQENLELLNQLHPTKPIISLNGRGRIGPFLKTAYIDLFAITAIVPKKMEKDTKNVRHTAIESKSWSVILN